MHLTRISQETNKQKRKIRERNMLLADEGAPKLCNEPRKLDKKLSGFYYEKKTQCKRA